MTQTTEEFLHEKFGVEGAPMEGNVITILPKGLILSFFLSMVTLIKHQTKTTDEDLAERAAKLAHMMCQSSIGLSQDDFTQFLNIFSEFSDLSGKEKGEKVNGSA